MTPYAASKLCGEALVQSYSQSFHFPSLIFRFFNIFGPWQRPDHQYAAVIPKWIWKGMKKEVIQVHGDGEQTRDFTYVDTVTSSLLKVHDLGLTSPHPINLAFGRKVSLNSLLNQLLTFFPDLRVEYLPERQGDIRESQNDPRVLFDTLPNLDVISFEEGLRRTIGWMLENTTQFIPHFLPKD
jgi:UDP-glucose 4-epimerase